MPSRARSCVAVSIAFAIAGCGSRVSLGFDIESGDDAGASSESDGAVFDTSTAAEVSVLDDAAVDESSSDDDATSDAGDAALDAD